MKRIILITFSLVLTFSLFSQTWKYKSEESPFDGKYKFSSVIGSGGEFPYNNPVFVVNLFIESEIMNIYLSNAGYAGCDNRIIYIKFDGDQNIYAFYSKTNSEKDIWFLQSSSEISSISLIELLDKIKAHNHMFIRLSSDCGQTDYKFSLSGSTTAINFVTAKYIKEQQAKAKLWAEKQKRKEELISLVAKGGYFKAKTLYKGSLYYEPRLSSYLKLTLKAGEEIKFSGYSDDKTFCILNNASLTQLPKDTIIYIKKSCIDINTVEPVDEE